MPANLIRSLEEKLADTARTVIKPHHNTDLQYGQKKKILKKKYLIFFLKNILEIDSKIELVTFHNRSL